MQGRCSIEQDALQHSRTTVCWQRQPIHEQYETTLLPVGKIVRRKLSERSVSRIGGTHCCSQTNKCTDNGSHCTYAATRKGDVHSLFTITTRLVTAVCRTCLQSHICRIVARTNVWSATVIRQSCKIEYIFWINRRFKPHDPTRPAEFCYFAVPTRPVANSVCIVAE